MTYQTLIPEVATAYNVAYFEVGSVQKGYRNESYRLKLASGEEVNLIFHKNEKEAYERIRSANKASAILSKVHFPVRTRYDTRMLKLSDSKKEIYAGLYTYLPGATIPWEAYAKDHIKLLGWAMSDMHGVWRQSQQCVAVDIIDELHPLLARMHRYFSTPEIQEALKTKLGIEAVEDLQRFEPLLNRLGSMPMSEKHILHMDLVRGNALFDNKGESPWYIDNLYLSGVIDFEKTAMGHPVFDIARTLAFLLVDCATKDRTSIYKYFLQSGYNKRGESSFRRDSRIAYLPAYQVLNQLIGFFLFHDFYKFLKHTPYESLESNHHFVRTRNILIDYGMIR